MLAWREFIHTLGDEFKDPMLVVIGSVRFAQGGKPIANSRAVINSMRRASSGASSAPAREIHVRR